MNPVKAIISTATVAALGVVATKVAKATEIALARAPEVGRKAGETVRRIKRQGWGRAR